MSEPFHIEAIIRKARSGDREAFDRLAAHYRSAVAFMKTGSREEAEDLAQEILLRAWQSLPSLLEPTAFAGWLRAIATNACRSRLRRSRP
ncbi:MAG: hypothetical protein IT210_04510 [Armatimonadetes bacterium]|nr:hypothetical protein [Armatimonadota bacterium]